MKKNRFKIQFHFINFYNISFGINICLNRPNVELHLPFGFLRIGWQMNNEVGIFKFTTKRNIENKNENG